MIKEYTYDNFINDNVCVYGLDFLRLDPKIKNWLFNNQSAILKILQTQHKEVFQSMDTHLSLFNTYKMN